MSTLLMDEVISNVDRSREQVECQQSIMTKVETTLEEDEGEEQLSQVWMRKMMDQKPVARQKFHH